MEGRLDPALGYARSSTGEATGYWLEDQAALLAAFLEAHRATGEQPWLRDAHALAALLMDSWWGDGGWRDSPEAATPSRAVINDVLPATLATLATALNEVGERTDERRFVDRARETSVICRSMASAAGDWSALVPG